MAWTDEKRELVKQTYVDIMENQYTTPEERAAASAEVVAEIAEKQGETVNGTRMILTKAGVYIKKAAVTKAKVASAEGGAKRVNKAEAHQTLTNLIATINPEKVDEEIIAKLTGKAANYFAEILLQVSPQE
jgi:hypothetical protein